MTIMKYSLILLQTIVFLFAAEIKSQDSLTIDQLQPITYTFKIENGVLSGKGANFIKKELSNAQFTMLGEYHDSKRISEFTEALIPFLDSCGYKTLVTEVGPISGQILNTLDGNIKEELHSLLNRYKVEEENDINPPFPFFEHVEDAAFLSKAKDQNWTILGIDQEYVFCHQLLIDQMYQNLNINQKKSINNLYENVLDSIESYNQLEIKGLQKLSISIKESEIIRDFINQASINEINRDIADAFYASNHIYWLYANRQWYENNATRISYMKSQLRKQLEEHNFDIRRDKLLVKMGSYHLSRGFSPLALHEVGNTLSELASYHGNESLNIAFSLRYYNENGIIQDILDSDAEYRLRLKDLLKMGKKDEWVVIDLRPMIKGHFYGPVKFKFNKYVEDLVKRYDLLVIPMTDEDPTRNY